MNRKISWLPDAQFYHIYPLGLCGAPPENDFASAPVNRLEQLDHWLPHIKQLGCNAMYLGPVFESDFHGYDTADYFMVDRRLGTNETLKAFSQQLHQKGIRLVLDTVFNHTGRNFWAFKDLQVNGENSKYKDWFAGVDFNQQSPYGDPFAYEGWYSAYNLVKLNLTNPEVKQHLFDAVAFWMDEFNIDGLRLDVAEIMDKQFLTELAGFCRARRTDFWLMGEVITGDYNGWANEAMLDATTNYEAYKGIYSSHNDHNYFEISYTLKRQFGDYGIYKDLLLYNFADNHDTTRIASILNNPAHLFPVYTLLYTMPGVPAVYYGSEWGLPGIKDAHEDTALRPAVAACDLPDFAETPLLLYIEQLARLRHRLPTLRYGLFYELYTLSEQFVFSRSLPDETVIIALNMAAEPSCIQVTIDHEDGTLFTDLLQPGYTCTAQQQQLEITTIPAYGARILAVRG